jgi:hypothetical protein
LITAHGGNTVGGWTSNQIHSAVLTTFQLSAKAHGPNQLRYDLRKLKGHALLQRDGRRYAYKLEAAYHKADKAIERIVDLLAAA